MLKMYAMILNNIVIEVLSNCEKAPKWPPDPAGNPVVAVECDETVKTGMVYNPETNTFSENVPPAPVEPTYEPLTPTEERQIDILLNTEYIACLLELQMG